MPVIPVKLDDIVETKPKPVGRYDLIVESCEEVESKNGKPQYDMSIAFDGDSESMPIRHFHSLPAANDEAPKFKFKVLMLKRLCHMFGIKLSGDEIDTGKIAMALVGKRANAEVGLDKETDAQGNEKPGGRVFNRLVIPTLPDEGGAGQRKAPPPPGKKS